jgi:hypothetical protein
MNQITLSENVMVSDPCYSLDTWCQTQLNNVLPGIFNVDVEKTDLGDWGVRISSITVIHKDYQDGQFNWDDRSTCGVDSGQCGVFCMTSYRNDTTFKKVRVKVLHTKKFNLKKRKKLRSKKNYKYKNSIRFKLRILKKGDKWYEKMCHFTLGSESWGLYDTGVVSSSGVGDGMYPLEVMEDNGKVVGIKVVFLGDDDEDDYEDEGDCCGVCGGELESDGECVYCCEEKTED